MNHNVTIIVPSYENDSYISDLHRILINEVPEEHIVYMAGSEHFAEKCNLGAMNAQTKYVLFLNNDTLPEKGFVQKLVDTLVKDDEWIATPMIIFHKTVVRHVLWNNEVQHVFGKRDKVQCAGVEFNKVALPFEYGRMKEQNDLSVKFRRRCLAVSGCCFLIDREKFISLGGFDEEFVNGWEDNDFMLRVLENGGVCVYEPEAKVRHHFAGSEGRFDNEEENYNRFVQKWNGRNVKIIMDARKRL